MQGYTNGVSIFQRDFAVKQDYPEIIKPEIIKVLSTKQRYGWLPRQRDRGAWKQKDIKNQTSFIQVLLDSIEKRMSIARELAHWTSVPGAAANR